MSAGQGSQGQGSQGQGLQGQGSQQEDGPLEDVFAPRPVVSSETVFEGVIWDVVRDEVDLGGEAPVHREILRHPGAVGVVVLDEDDRVLVLRQYRHATGYELWEVPAGILDQDGEDPVDAAARELGEESDLRAGRWDLLVDWYNSPGYSDEAIRVYLARDLEPVPEAERFDREHEEADMPLRWVPLDELRDAVLAGAVHNPTAVVGILAAAASRDGGWTSLRPARSPWPQHKAYRDAGS